MAPNSPSHPANNPALNAPVMQAVEQLGYRVTVGDVAAQVGLNVQQTEQALLVLASEAGGHLQVSEAGEIAYRFPQNFRSILRDKYWRWRWQERLSKLWKFLFYLIRISFGLVLIASIILLIAAIAIIFIALSSSQRDDNRSGDGGFSIGFPSFYWFSSDWYYIFLPDYYDRRSSYRSSRRSSERSEMNFLEAIFSFLFGDGNPNANLDDRRWRTIATVIRTNGGAIAAEQVAPYLDELGSGSSREFEDYMLPVLTRFNGRPEVSDVGQLVYHFPELQITATPSLPATSAGARSTVPLVRDSFLKEALWRFSTASAGQRTGAIALGGVNLVAAIVLGGLLRGGIAAQLGGLVAFVAGIYGVLLVYAIGFFAVPLLRYAWIQQRNQRIQQRNQEREQRSIVLRQPDQVLQQKLAFARQFTNQTVVNEADLAYTTEQDLTEQELLNADKIDEEWQRRLQSRS